MTANAARQEHDVTVLKSLIGELLDLACGHFREEESALFDTGERVLGGIALTEMGERWAAGRNVNVNGGGYMATRRP